MALSKHSAYDNDNDEGERLAWSITREENV